MRGRPFLLPRSALGPGDDRADDQLANGPSDAASANGSPLARGRSTLAAAPSSGWRAASQPKIARSAMEGGAAIGRGVTTAALRRGASPAAIAAAAPLARAGPQTAGRDADGEDPRQPDISRRKPARARSAASVIAEGKAALNAKVISPANSGLPEAKPTIRRQANGTTSISSAGGSARARDPPRHHPCRDGEKAWRQVQQIRALIC
jgi:hypothetical protein